MTRSCPEWIGTTDDAAIPQRVRLRVFDRFGGVCQLTNRKIRPGDNWQCDHIIALANGGRHAEDNLQPVLAAPHREKSREDVKVKAKIARQKAAHLGVNKPKTRGFYKPDGAKYDWSRGRYVRAE